MAETIFWLVVCILVTWRASRGISQEDGPFDLFSRAQEWAGGNKTWIGRGLGCPYCVGVYASLIVVIIAAPWLGIADWRQFVLYWGSVSSGQAIVQKVIG